MIINPICVSEAELVRMCKKGDEKCQRQLFETYSNRFFRLALRYLKASAEAEDTVMQTFVKIFNNMKNFTYSDAKGFESWMYKILVNEALMALRRRHNFYLTETLDEGNPEHETEIFQETDTSYLYQLILNLPDGYRTVFNLYAIEGYGHHEIAELLCITEGTSRSQLFKAKELLKRKINQEGLYYGT